MFISKGFNVYEDKEFVQHIQEKVGSKKVYLWGCSSNNKFLYKILNQGILDGIIDNNSNNWGKYEKGLLVQKCPSNCDEIVIISAIGDPSSLIYQLCVLNVNNYYFFLEDSNFKNHFEKSSRFLSKTNTNFVFDNTSNKILHVIPDEKFFIPIVYNIRKYFDLSEHLFLIYNFNKSNYSDQYNLWNEYSALSIEHRNISIIGNIFDFDLKRSERILKIHDAIKNSKKIIFHGEGYGGEIIHIFESHIPEVKFKSLFIVWGAMFSYDPQNSNNFVAKVLHFCPNVLLNKIGESRKVLLDKFGFKNYNILDFPFSYTIPYVKKSKSINHKRRVLISNSINSCNDIEESIQLLSKYKGKIEVFCIASYGDIVNHSVIEEIASKIEQKGIDIFANDFHIIKSFMTLPEYNKFINTIDIAVFSSKAGNAMTTIKTLCLSGAKIYINSNCKTANLLTSRNIKWTDIKSIEFSNFEEFCKNTDVDNNYSMVEQEFSEQYIKRMWKNILL